MKRFAISASLIAGLLLAGPANLSKNMELLQVTMDLDRQEYIEGEDIRVVITVRNPTRAALLIPRPFDSRSARLSYEEKGGILARAYGFEWGAVNPTDVQFIDSPPPPPPTTRIAPGQTLRYEVFASGAARSTSEHKLAGPGVVTPRKSGEYRLVYSWGPIREFKILIPEAYEQMIGIDLPLSVQQPYPGEAKTRPVAVFVIGSHGKHVLGMSRRPLGVPTWTLGTFDEAGHRLTAGSGLIREVFRRLFESDMRIESLEGNCDEQGIITLRWNLRPATGQPEPHEMKVDWREYRIQQ